MSVEVPCNELDRIIAMLWSVFELCSRLKAIMKFSLRDVWVDYETLSFELGAWSLVASLGLYTHTGIALTSRVVLHEMR